MIRYWKFTISIRNIKEDIWFNSFPMVASGTKGDNQKNFLMR